MAPKNAHAADAPVNPEQLAILQESERLKKKALDLQLLCDEPVKATRQLSISKALAKCNGFDVIKKSSVRKNRHLVIISAQLAPASAGRLGTLAQLDTKNPVMYIEFPAGRLKLFGTLVFPKSKHVVLRVAPGHVLCEDVFESMLVFSKVWWIGSKDENPEENELLMPPDLSTGPTPHKSYHFSYGAQSKETDMLAKLGSQAGMSQSQDPDMGTASQRSRRASAARVKYTEDPFDDMDDGDDSDAADNLGDGSADDGMDNPSQARTSRSRRLAGVKRSYKEVDEDENDADEDNDDGDVSDGNKMRVKTQLGSSAEDLKRRKKEAGLPALVTIDSDDEATAVQAARPTGRKSQANKGKKAVQPAFDLISDSSDDEPIVTRAVRGSGQAGTSTAVAARRTPSRAAITAAKQRLAQASEDDSDDGENEDDEANDDGQDNSGSQGQGQDTESSGGSSGDDDGDD